MKEGKSCGNLPRIQTVGSPSSVPWNFKPKIEQDPGPEKWRDTKESTDKEIAGWVNFVPFSRSKGKEKGEDTSQKEQLNPELACFRKL